MKINKKQKIIIAISMVTISWLSIIGLGTIIRKLINL